MKESKINKAIRDYVKRNGGFIVKYHGSQFTTAGFPDFIGAIIHKGKIVHFIIEVKQPDGNPTKLQESWVTKLKLYGYCSGIVYSLEDFVNLLDAYVEKVKQNEIQTN